MAKCPPPFSAVATLRLPSVGAVPFCVVQRAGTRTGNRIDSTSNNLQAQTLVKTEKQNSCDAGRNQDRMAPISSFGSGISSVPNGIRPPYPTDNLVFDRLPEQSSSRSGPVILMLPGWRNNRNSDAPLGFLLSGCYDTVLLGLPGFSQASPLCMMGNWGTTEYADCVFHFLKENNISEVIVVGHSFGARVGIHLAFKHPEIVRSLS